VTSLVRSWALLVTAVLVFAACDSNADPGPTTSSSSTTTTTIENDTCDRVAADTATYLEDLIDTLDETRLEELVDVEAWGGGLRGLQRAGKDLDLRVGALRCDAVEIQQRAFAEADLIPDGPLSAQLLEMLLTPSTITTIPETTTTTVVDGATTSTEAVTTDG
jgi:hypothetical protein